MLAYNAQEYEVKGPDWLSTQRFDIVAKVPPGATRDDLRVMIRNLLAERFKMVAHRGSAEGSLYALIVGKSGPKLRESAAEPRETPATSAGSPRQGAGSVDENGFPLLPGGHGNIMRRTANGDFYITGGHRTMADLATMLSVQVGRPVIDMTGLKGEYDYHLQFSTEGMAVTRSGGGAPESGVGPSDVSPILFTALQEQLGLKLETRKGTVDVVIVDSIDKVPIDN
jgi:uncharacterized protein (TIGR03435 family)